MDDRRRQQGSISAGSATIDEEDNPQGWARQEAARQDQKLHWSLSQQVIGTGKMR
jgi:hypothetical protein